jgi:2-oxo-3-hexenedioate decarboxylase/2-keto-4-pentenoate hydratase
VALDPDQLSNAASCLVKVRLGGPKLDALPPDCAPQDIEDAYLLQRELSAGLEQAGLGAVVGQKIGCTTPVMQRFLGIDTPSAGRVHAANVFDGTASIALGRQHRIGVEVEIAVRLGRDLDDPWFATPERAATAVSAVMPAIELVQDRYVDYPSMPAATLVADDFFAWGAVLGPEREPPDFDGWRTIPGVLEIDGVRTAGGDGAMILGHPMKALAWLVARRIADGTPLQAGQFVCLGSVVQTHFVDSPQRCRAVFTGLGQAGASFHA